MAHPTQLGVPANVVAAIKQIESRNRPRLMRFEPHVFHRDTGERYLGEVPWTRSRGNVSLVASETNRAAFERAARLDYDAAVRASSWGSGQVLGGAGIRRYGSAEAFVQAFDANSERVSDELMHDWFRARPQAVEAIQRRDWARLKILYNGTGASPWLERFLAALGEEKPPSAGWLVGGVAFTLAAVGLSLWGVQHYGRRRR